MSKISARRIRDFLRDLTPTQKAALERLKRLLDNPQTGELRWYYAIGKSLLAMHAPWSDYGTNWIACVVEALSCSRELVYRSYRFARGYTVKGLEELRRQKIAWNQVVVLLNVRAPQQRRQLQQQAAAERWSFRRLRAEIHAVCGYGPSRGGRKPQRQDFGPRVALRELVRTAQHWLDVNKLFRPARSGTLHQLDKLPRAQQTPELLRELRRAETLVTELAEAAGSLRRELADRAKRLEADLQYRAKPRC